MTREEAGYIARGGAVRSRRRYKNRIRFIIGHTLQLFILMTMAVIISVIILQGLRIAPERVTAIFAIIAYLGAMAFVMMKLEEWKG